MYIHKFYLSFYTTKIFQTVINISMKIKKSNTSEILFLEHTLTMKINPEKSRLHRHTQEI